MLRDTSPQRFESFDAVVLSPDKSVEWGAFSKSGIAGEPDDIAVLIDRRRRVPPLSAKIADVSHPAVFPKHGVLGGMSSNGLVADARNAHDLTIVIDRRGGSGSVAGDQREFVDLIWRSQSPHGWAKLEDLGAAARGVMNAILGPPDYLTEVVGSCSKTVVSTRKVGKSPHLVLFPNEPEIDISDVVRRTVESRAAPALAEQLRVGSLGNTHQDSRRIFHVPCDTAVWSAECAEVG